MMKRKFETGFFVLCLLFTGLSAAFADPSADRKLFEIPDREANTLSPADHTELTAVFSGDETELDFRKSYLASEAQIFTGLYEGLFSYHPRRLDPVPAVASAWKLSEDKKIWTFTIRQDAKFQNGDPVRAEDFRAAWISLLDPQKNSPYSSLYDVIEGAREYRLGIISNPEDVGISAPDNKTLIVRLNAPAAFFPSMLCHHSFSPIHPSMLNARDWSMPVSNGPFYVSENENGRMVLLKNKLYWDADRVVLEKIILRFTDEGDESAAMWNSGEARWIAGNVNFDALADRSGVMINEMFATHYYYIRAEGPWQDHRVRRALALALPWDEIRSPHSKPAKTLIYPLHGYPQIKGFETTDLEEAQRLLEEAGFPKGVGLPELVIRITPAEDADRIGKLMASAWMKLGIPVKLDVVPFNQYFLALKNYDYNIGSTTWIGDFADPYTFLQMWRKNSNLNDSGYNDEDYEALMERSMTEEGTERFETLGKAEQLLLDRGTVLPISYTLALNIVDTDELDGWFPNALDIHPFKYFSFKAFKPLPGVTMGKKQAP